MRFSDIVRLAKDYLTLGIVAVIILAILFSLGYFFVYKKLMKGSKSFSKRRAILAVLSVCYAVVVFGAVFMSRGGHFSSYSLQPFSSYFAAWNQWSMSGWRNIVLNILLFVPLGVLLPLWSKRLQKAWAAVLCGFLVSLSIELAQLLTARGVFEVDDLINNTFGTWIGYGVFKLVLTTFTRQKSGALRVVGHIAPLLIALLAFGGIFTAYSLKELGNLGETSTYGSVRNDVLLSSAVSFSDKNGTADIYQAVVGKEQDARALARSIFTAIGRSLNEADANVYDESALYYASSDGENDSGLHMWVTYKGMTYRYNDFSQFDEDAEPVVEADEATIRSALARFKLELPEKLLFTAGEHGVYSFTAENVVLGDQLWQGTLRCQYYSDGTIKEIDNQLIAAEFYRSGAIISEAAAYKKIEDGNFASNGRYKNVSSIEVKNVALTYKLDSKGFYQPVYRFDCKLIDDKGPYEGIITIAALK